MDLDGSLSGQTWTWERSQNRSSWTEISAASGGSYTPVDADLDHYLRATVGYTDGHGMGKSKQETTTQQVEPALITNRAPAFDNSTESRSVAENSVSTTAVGARVQASDPRQR